MLFDSAHTQAEGSTYIMLAAQFGSGDDIVKPVLKRLCRQPGANINAVDVRFDARAA